MPNHKMKANMEEMKLVTFESISRIHITLLKMIGILPFEGRTYSFLGSKILAIYHHTCIMIHSTMFTWYALKNARHGLFEIGNISEVIAINGALMRYMYLFRYRFQFLDMVKFCEDIWNGLELSEKFHVSYFAKKSSLLCWLYMIIVGLINVCYVLASYLMKPPGLYSNETMQRMLPYKFYVEIEETPWFEMTCALQIIVASAVGVICSGVDTVAAFLSMMSCGHLRLLQNRLHEIRKLSDGCYRSKESEATNSQKYFRMELVTCIRYHQQILAFCEDIDTLTRSITMSAIMCSLYNMSLIGIILAGDDPGRFKYLFMLSMYLIQLFVCQWASDHLMNQSKAVADEAYLIPSQKNIADSRKLIMFMTMRSQRPVYLTAGGLVKLSMERFGSMITSAFSFFTVLRRLNI